LKDFLLFSFINWVPIILKDSFNVVVYLGSFILLNETSLNNTNMLFQTSDFFILIPSPNSVLINQLHTQNFDELPYFVSFNLWGPYSIFKFPSHDVIFLRSTEYHSTKYVYILTAYKYNKSFPNMCKFLLFFFNIMFSTEDIANHPFIIHWIFGQ